MEVCSTNYFLDYFELVIFDKLWYKAYRLISGDEMSCYHFISRMMDAVTYLPGVFMLMCMQHIHTTLHPQDTYVPNNITYQPINHFRRPSFFPCYLCTAWIIFEVEFISPELKLQCFSQPPLHMMSVILVVTTMAGNQPQDTYGMEAGYQPHWYMITSTPVQCLFNSFTHTTEDKDHAIRSLLKSFL